MMSLKGGGMGDIEGQPIQSRTGSLAAPEGFMIDPNFQTGFGGEPFTKDPNYVTPKQESLDKQKSLLASTRLRTEFINRPEVKDYLIVNTNIAAMDSLLTNSMRGDNQSAVALDQGLITMYNKMTDPQSTIRESEYARTPENISLRNRFEGAFSKLQKGGAGLTNEDRQSLVWAAKLIGEQRKASFDETLQSYKELATEYGIDPNLVTRGMEQRSSFVQPKNKQSSTSMPTIQDIQAAKQQGYRYWDSDKQQFVK